MCVPQAAAVCPCCVAGVHWVVCACRCCLLTAAEESTSVPLLRGAGAAAGERFARMPSLPVLVLTLTLCVFVVRRCCLMRSMTATLTTNGNAQFVGWSEPTPLYLLGRLFPSASLAT